MLIELPKFWGLRITIPTEHTQSLGVPMQLSAFAIILEFCPQIFAVNLLTQRP